MPGRVEKLRDSPQLPPGVVDGLLDLHAAIDVDSGHFICHYYGARPQILRINGTEYPGLGVGDWMSVVVGEEPARAVEESGEEATLEGLTRGEPVNVDRASLTLVFNLYRHEGGTIKAVALEGAAAVIVKPERRPPITVILWEKKPERENRSLLTV
ncbi:MAG: hypothetical protein F7C34_01395 [Desulfurococcales archaeon]|nr:hypothetical protein [Desulfurococcales archaeon]